MNEPVTALIDPAYVEQLYQQYRTDPQQVDPSWRHFFRGMEYALTRPGGEVDTEKLDKELKVLALIFGYRQRGHYLSDTNPIRPRKDRRPRLDLVDYGLSDDDLDTPFYAGIEVDLPNAPLREIIARLRKIYCGHIGIEYMHIHDSDIRWWLRRRFESTVLDFGFSPEKKRRIFEQLSRAVLFEKFLNTKFIGQKRFSLEGGESAIPALDAIITAGSKAGVEVFAIGMAHRGRLNVLANIFGKQFDYIFGEFEDRIEQTFTMGYGDVKYHLGYSAERVWETTGRTVKLKLVPNPSHLESVTPVVIGYTRSKGDHQYNQDRKRLLPIVFHGDAAIAGQGVVYETLQMWNLPGYRVGGAIHYVINNQIGFTTDFDEARSSDYSTAVARAFDMPVLHVNGDDVEAVVYAVELAVEFRQKFHRDIFIDVVGYRKHGHNEGDEPKFTQPKLYQLIARHPDPRTIYLQQLEKEGVLDKSEARRIEEAFKDELTKALEKVRNEQTVFTYIPPELDSEWKALRHGLFEDFEKEWPTAAPREVLDRVIEVLTHIPDHIKPIPKIRRLIDERKKRYREDRLDWALGELLAYGSLIAEGKNVRLSGEDSIRGTFSHRHAAVYDAETEEPYFFLHHLGPNQGKFWVYNSILSEYGVLGFEYGYSIAYPHTLTIWEAQFGDFANGAQVIIDQYIASAEAKWQIMSGLTLYLPHGYEGQGPEHSSARPERFLQLAADCNMIVANPTTPANLFHILRRQLQWPFRKPLILFTPKSLLRHPECISSVDDLTQGRFQEVIDDPSVTDPAKVRRVLFCTGKIFYDLSARKAQLGEKAADVAIVRIEQLYPMPHRQIEQIMKKYARAEFVWIQEEPKNMGYWTFWLRHIEYAHQWRLISRKAAASPATGFHRQHVEEQEALLRQAFER